MNVKTSLGSWLMTNVALHRCLLFCVKTDALPYNSVNLVRFICPISVSMAGPTRCILPKYFLVNFFC